MREKEEFIRHFREVQPKFSRFYARLLLRADLNLSQFALLSLLAGLRRASMTEAGRELHVSKPAVTNLADRLEASGLVKRTPHPSDRRIFLLSIQPRGERTVRKMQSEALGFLLKAFNKLTASERRTITRFYSLLSKTMDEVLQKNKK